MSSDRGRTLRVISAIALSLILCVAAPQAAAASDGASKPSAAAVSDGPPTPARKSCSARRRSGSASTCCRTCSAGAAGRRSACRPQRRAAGPWLVPAGRHRPAVGQGHARGLLRRERGRGSSRPARVPRHFVVELGPEPRREHPPDRELVAVRPVQPRGVRGRHREQPRRERSCRLLDDHIADVPAAEGTSAAARRRRSSAARRGREHSVTSPLSRGGSFCAAPHRLGWQQLRLPGAAAGLSRAYLPHLHRVPRRGTGAPGWRALRRRRLGRRADDDGRIAAWWLRENAS
jgi:hypothetical protein